MGEFPLSLEKKILYLGKKTLSLEKFLSLDCLEFSKNRWKKSLRYRFIPTAEFRSWNEPISQEPFCKRFVFLVLKALAFIQQNQRDFGIRKSKVLNVQGAFHTPLMQPAVEPFKQALSMIRVQKPRIEVYSNVTGEKYKDALAIHKHLPQQIVK